jgi:hypothetical protein
MPETPTPLKKQISPDWFVQGILTRIGDIFDRLTGRGWKPGSSLATSELIERLKKLIDGEIKTDADGRRFAPHNIKLKMQWDKFSTDAENSLTALKNEMLTAVVDHINDKHLYTHAPISIEVKTDYFTEGIKLFVGFDPVSGEDNEREFNVTLPGTKVEIPQAPAPEEPAAQARRNVIVRFDLNGKSVERSLELVKGERITIGRTKENHIAIDDASISKYHAAIVLNADQRVVIADTGSTNGTFVRGTRISYGKALEIHSGEKVKFGAVESSIEIVSDPAAAAEKKAAELEPPKTEAYRVGEFEFTKKPLEPAKTEAAIELPPTQAAIDLNAVKNDGTGEK